MSDAALLLRKSLGARKPQMALILGSGLGPIAEDITDPLFIPYRDLPGFPSGNVAGHEGRVVAGRLHDREILLFQGRAHYYEHGKADIMKPVIQALKALGIEQLILTNAAGSLRPEMGAGSVMLLTDHLNLTGVSPLFGEKGNARFVDMIDAYDPGLRARFRIAARHENLELHEGVYAWLSGPQFETPAEIRMIAKLGGDAVGMSTVPEVILARHAGIKVAALSIITNLGAGMTKGALSHYQTMEQANLALEKVRVLLKAFFFNHSS